MKNNTCIIMSENRLPSSSSIVDITTYANYKYAKHNRYDFMFYRPYIEDINSYDIMCCVNPSIGTNRHASWAKILAAHNALKSYERVVYIDSDAIFNTLTSIDYFLSHHNTKNKDIMFLADYPYHENTPCAGFFILNHSAAAFTFLKDWYCGLHNEFFYDHQGTWEQASLCYWGLTNVKLLEPCVVLPVNQFKYKNLNIEWPYTACSNIVRSLPEHDLTGNRQLINHYRMKIYEEIKADVEKIYGLDCIEEVRREILNYIYHFKTGDYKF